MTESFPASVNSIEKFEKEAGRPMSKSIEWCSKNVAIEGGLVRLFGPPPECHELDRIDLGRGALSVSKKVSEGMTEDGGKIYLASVEIEFGEEVSSSSVHVVMTDIDCGNDTLPSTCLCWRGRLMRTLGRAVGGANPVLQIACLQE